MFIQFYVLYVISEALKKQNKSLEIKNEEDLS